MPSPIGDVLSRKPKRKDSRDSIRVTGAVNGGWVVECATIHDTPFWVSSAELARDYGAQLDEGPSDYERLRKLDDEATVRAANKLFQGRPTRPQPADGSPESVFAAAAEAEPDDA